MQYMNPDSLNDWDVTPLNSAPIAVLVANTAARIRYTNSRLDKLFGYSEGKLRDELFDVIIPSQSSRHLRAIFSQPYRLAATR